MGTVSSNNIVFVSCDSCLQRQVFASKFNVLVVSYINQRFSISRDCCFIISQTNFVISRYIQCKLILKSVGRTFGIYDLSILDFKDDLVTISCPFQIIITTAISVLTQILTFITYHLNIELPSLFRNLF